MGRKRGGVGEMKTFLICPVRGHDPDEQLQVVRQLEVEGWTVHFPPRDTDQNDSTGLRICTDNRAAIESADIIHVVWDGKSQGSLFDLGMAFALRKPLRIVLIPDPTEGKSFQNMMRQWEHENTSNAD